MFELIYMFETKLIYYVVIVKYVSFMLSIKMVALIPPVKRPPILELNPT